MRKLADVLGMKMESVPRRPPNFSEIIRVFPFVEHRTGVLFAWGDKIYNPDNVPIPTQLLAHECVHSLQHNGAPEFWWDCYLLNRSFRFAQELEAHRVEIEEYNRHHNRDLRRHYFVECAKRLSSPLYGNLITLRKAKALLFEGRTIDE